MKIVGYLIFACFYYIFRFFCPIKKKKVFCIMTHDGSKGSNIGLIVQYLKDKQDGYSFQYIKNAERNLAKDIRLIRGKLSFFIIKPYHLATSEYVLLDNVFLPMAYLKFNKRVRVVQLWHGTGTIKKFGQDVNTGQLKYLEKKSNSRITHLIVNSERTKKEYAQAFGVKEDKVFIYGLPRTDIFFDNKMIEEKKREFYQQFPNLKDKKLVLYVPTFRDHELEHPKLAIDMDLLCNTLSDEFVFMLRLHPFVAETYEKENSKNRTDRVISMSTYSDINTLLLVSDFLITDYSSVIFEYCLMGRPMIFYAYDLERFSEQGRGFYQSYEVYVPGPIVQDSEAISQVLKNNQFDMDKIENFKQKNYQFLDGKSIERLYLNIFSY